MLELDQVVKRFPSGEETVEPLAGVSMRVRPGEFVTLYGPSGSGKTTLVTIIAALMAPDSGTVSVAGRDVGRLSRRESARYRRLELGYVAQSPELLAGVPAIDNAALKLLDMRMGVREAHRRVAPLMERLGLEGRLRHRPGQLSAGERQRVLIARALATGPRLLVADEPTGNLDSARTTEVLELLTELCREHDLALLLVTHDPEAADFATRVHTLRDGQIHDGAPDKPTST